MQDWICIVCRMLYLKLIYTFIAAGLTDGTLVTYYIKKTLGKPLKALYIA